MIGARVGMARAQIVEELLRQPHNRVDIEDEKLRLLVDHELLRFGHRTRDRAAVVPGRASVSAEMISVAEFSLGSRIKT